MPLVVQTLDVELGVYRKQPGKEHIVRLIEDTMRSKKVLIVNEKSLKTYSFSAHGGQGKLDIKFAFSEFEHFSDPKNDSGWQFFGIAELPVGATAGLHIHDGDDEFFTSWTAKQCLSRTARSGQLVRAT
jgi:hypothetical protein